MKLVIFFLVMATITTVVDRMLARIDRNDGGLRGGGLSGMPPGVDA
jgi:hypothetical protein